MPIEVGPVERIGGRHSGTAKGTSLYTRDADHNLLEFIMLDLDRSTVVLPAHVGDAAALPAERAHRMVCDFRSDHIAKAAADTWIAWVDKMQATGHPRKATAKLYAQLITQAGGGLARAS